MPLYPSGPNAFETFQKKLVSGNPHSEETLRHLCACGCQREQLTIHLFCACTCACLDFALGRLDSTRRALAGGHGIPKSELERLPTQIRSVAALIKRVNMTPLAPEISIRCASDEPERRAARNLMIAYYRILPTVLDIYAAHFECQSAFASTIFKRLTTTQVETIRLLGYVEEATSTPHYEYVVSLLDRGCDAFGIDENSRPACFSVTALTKLYQRHGKLLGRATRIKKKTR